MAWYEALVPRWKGAVVVEAWFAPGGYLAFVAAGSVVAVVGALHSWSTSSSAWGGFKHAKSMGMDEVYKLNLES